MTFPADLYLTPACRTEAGVAMFGRLNLRTRLFCSYSTFLLLLLLAISSVIYIYLNNNLIRNTDEGIRQSVQTVSDKLDEFVGMSENITRQMYFNKSLMDAIETVAHNQSETARNAACKEIDNQLFALGWTNSGIHRLNIFNAKGDFFSDQPNDRKVSAVFPGGRILNAARRRQGAPLVLYAPADRWLADSREPVFSFIRQIRAGELEYGFLEIQIPVAQIIRAIPFTNLRNGKLAIFKQREILYPTQCPLRTNVPFYRRIIAGKRRGSINAQNGAHPKEHLVFLRSNATGYRTVFVIPDRDMYRPLRVFRNLTLLIAGAVIAVSLGIFYLLAGILTRPLRDLRRALQDTDIINTRIALANLDNDDEIALLNQAFADLRTRLRKTLDELVKAKTLQLKMHFEVLQSQINPHFLFNMLGIIAISCNQNRAGDAADICYKLSDFLRYTVSTSGTPVTFRDEIELTREYLELLKHRYTYRLNFEIQTDPEIMTVAFPKLTLQPLVENCIIHGFKGIDREMRIRINSSIRDGAWEVTIVDNGGGFSEAALGEITQKIAHCNDNLNWDNQADHPENGIMGIVNTYARLKLLYKNGLQLKLGNNPGVRGAYIQISGSCAREREPEVYQMELSADG